MYRIKQGSIQASQDKALMFGDDIYILKRFDPKWIGGRSSNFRWWAFKNGERWGYYSSIKEWEAAVRNDRKPPVPAYAVPSIIAEAISTTEAERTLRQLQANLNKDPE